MSAPADDSVTSSDSKGDVSGGSSSRDLETSTDASSPSQNVSSVAKTPVSLLQELYVRRGITPKYDLVQIEGAVHEPTFKYRVTVGEFVATGCGQSKKKAKHTAAKAVLDKIRQSQQKGIKGLSNSLAKALQIQSDDGAKEESGTEKGLLPRLPDLDKADIMSPYDDGIEGNPVGELQELCMNRRTQPPVYEVQLEEGQPHERKFAIVCSVAKQSEAGFGKSKKLAKRQAASKMLRRLKEQPADVMEGGSGDGGFANAALAMDDDELAIGICNAARGVIDGPPVYQPPNAKQAKPGDAFRVANFYKNLKPVSKKLAELQSVSSDDLKEEPGKRLDEVCEDQKLTLSYVDLEEISKTGQRMCLLQVSTIPVAVCFGTGEDVDAAREAAALNALQFLTEMSR